MIGPFGDCYKHVNEVPLYASCVENVCSFPLDTSLPCDYYEHFAQICGVAEVLPTDWREGIPAHCGKDIFPFQVNVEFLRARYDRGKCARSSGI